MARSFIMSRGIVKRLMYFAIVAVAVIADNVTGANRVLRVAVIGFLIANEALSILENYAATGNWVPQFLVNVLMKLKNDGGEIEIKQKEYSRRDPAFFNFCVFASSQKCAMYDGTEINGMWHYMH